jgi:hypothetical protein
MRLVRRLDAALFWRCPDLVEDFLMRPADAAGMRGASIVISSTAVEWDRFGCERLCFLTLRSAISHGSFLCPLCGVFIAPSLFLERAWLAACAGETPRGTTVT